MSDVYLIDGDFHTRPIKRVRCRKVEIVYDPNKLGGYSIQAQH